MPTPTDPTDTAELVRRFHLAIGYDTSGVPFPRAVADTGGGWVKQIHHALLLFKRDQRIATLEGKLARSTEAALINFESHNNVITNLEEANAELAEARAEPEFLLDCLAGKLTTFGAICGYVSLLESQVAEAQADSEIVEPGS